MIRKKQSLRNVWKVIYVAYAFTWAHYLPLNVDLKWWKESRSVIIYEEIKGSNSTKWTEYNCQLISRRPTTRILREEIQYSDPVI